MLVVRHGTENVTSDSNIKSKFTNIPNSEETAKVKYLIKWQNQMPKHIKRMDNKCHKPYLIQRKWWIKPGFIASLTFHLTMIVA